TRPHLDLLLGRRDVRRVAGNRSRSDRTLWYNSTVMNSTSDQLDGLDGAVPTPPVRRNAVLSRLAGWCYDHRRRVLLIWLVALVVVSVVSGIIRFNSRDRVTGGSSGYTL